MTGGNQKWHSYTIIVKPHETTYKNIVWHGTYLKWMESARIEYLRLLGIDYTSIVCSGYDFVIVSFSMSCPPKPLRMEEDIVLESNLEEVKGVQMIWEQNLLSKDRETVYMKASVALSIFHREEGEVVQDLSRFLEEKNSTTG